MEAHVKTAGLLFCLSLSRSLPQLPENSPPGKRRRGPRFGTCRSIINKAESRETAAATAPSPHPLAEAVQFVGLALWPAGLSFAGTASANADCSDSDRALTRGLVRGRFRQGRIRFGGCARDRIRHTAPGTIRLP